jgi:DNA gyrase/topoisomerase IV subunit B
MKKVYDEKAIKVLKGLEGVRKRPTMYLVEKGDTMVGKMVSELVDNAVDEYLAGRNKSVEIVAKKDWYIVADKAEGIPVGMHEELQISTLTLIFTELHAGGKFSDEYYSSSGGVHGVGASVVNAVSAVLEVWTYRKGWYYQKFQKGKIITKVIKLKSLPKEITKELSYIPKKGTIIKFIPDQTVVSASSNLAVLNLTETKEWLKNVALLNSGLEVTYTADNQTRTFLNKKGLGVCLHKKLNKLKVEAISPEIELKTSSLAFAVQWSSYDQEDGLDSYVSSIPTKNGGTHVDGFYSGLIKAISLYKTRKDKFTTSDIRTGLIGVMNWRMSQPEFSSQGKERLTSLVGKQVETIVFDYFKKYFQKNKSLVKKLIKRANNIKKTKEDFKKVMEGVSSIKKKKNGVLLPNILSVAKCKPHERELFICEGDSAMGTAKRARNVKFQEVLKVQGKPANALKMSLSKLLKCEPILNILTAIGYDYNKKGNPLDRLRVNNIFLLSDPDPDGPLQGDTIIFCPNGEYSISYLTKWAEENPEEAKDGILVYARNCVGKTVIARAYYPKIAVVTNKIYKVYLTSGGYFECTEDHKWVVNKDGVQNKNRCSHWLGHDYLATKFLTKGDVLSMRNTEKGIIARVEFKILDKPIPFYCMTVPTTGNFYVYNKFGDFLCSSNSHINVLELSLLYKMIPQIFDSGRVYVCNSPLFTAYVKNKRYMGATFEECFKKCPPNTPKHLVKRAKGLGEMSVDTLTEVAFDPQTRSVIQLQPVKGKEETYFKDIMSSNSAARKKLLGL